MQWATFEKMVVLRHTLFGLPWLLMSVALAFVDPLTGLTAHLDLATAFWMLLAFATARASAMAFNRLVDQQQDRANPRTKDRVLPSGEATVKQVRYVAWGCVFLFVLSCAAINTLTLLLAPLSILLQWSYSYFKHYTPYCHFVMALNHLMLPLFVWAALTGTITGSALLLGLAIFALIGANDVVYGMQDVEFDRKQGLHSLPLDLGITECLWVVRVLHLLAVGLLLNVGLRLGLPPLYFLGVIAAACLCFYHNLRLDPKSSSSIYGFMFYCNTRVAMTLTAFTIASVLWPIML